MDSLTEDLIHYLFVHVTSLGIGICFTVNFNILYVYEVINY